MFSGEDFTNRREVLAGPADSSDESGSRRSLKKETSKEDSSGTPGQYRWITFASATAGLVFTLGGVPNTTSDNESGQAATTQAKLKANVSEMGKTERTLRSWPAANARRRQLIKKRRTVGLSRGEKAELASLRSYARRREKKENPLPFKKLEDFEALLKRKMEQS